MDGHPLKRWRRENNLTLEALGQQIGVTRSSLSHYETGARIPRPQIMEKIREATGGAVRPADFYPSQRGAE